MLCSHWGKPLLTCDPYVISCYVISVIKNVGGVRIVDRSLAPASAPCSGSQMWCGPGDSIPVDCVALVVLRRLLTATRRNRMVDDWNERPCGRSLRSPLTSGQKSGVILVQAGPDCNSQHSNLIRWHHFSQAACATRQCAFSLFSRRSFHSLPLNTRGRFIKILTGQPVHLYMPVATCFNCCLLRMCENIVWTFKQRFESS